MGRGGRCNSAGSVVFSIGCHVQTCDNAEEAEASALVIGLKCLRNVHRGQVYVESDCAAVVNAMNNEGRNKAKWWAKYEEAKSLLRDFNLSEVRKIKR